MWPPMHTKQQENENKAAVDTDKNLRSFADYIFGSLILHLFCVNYLN